MTTFIEGGVTAAKGFQAAGVHCGIRKNRAKKDLGLIVSDRPASAAAVYTRNLVKGAPLTVTQAHIADGRARAIVCNSGIANTCAFDGIEKAEAMCALTAEALGIDAAAHTGALDGGGRTVAVLGSALDKPYPQENEPLMRRILESGGSVVSEYAPGMPPSRYSFLQRNRIIAGMCLGTLVTEGPRRSGALNTATRTLESGREVFALPGNVDSPGAQLPNMLISEGARLVTGAADILSALVIEPKDAPKAAQAAVAPMEAPAEKKPHIPGGLDETQRAICAALLAGEADFDALCAVSGLESDELGALLIEMEMDGLVTPLAGTRYAPGTQMTG